MSDSESSALELEKPVQSDLDVKLPPFPEPTKADFDEDLSEEEIEYYKRKFPELGAVRGRKLHCTACDRHLGSAARSAAKLRAHPLLRALVCLRCLTFYNSGEFDKGEDGSELYCRWCGQGGQVYCCADCPHVFCAKCIRRNLGAAKIKEIENADDWKCFKCSPRSIWDIRAVCWALLRYCDLKNQFLANCQDPDLRDAIWRSCAEDFSTCCKVKKKREPPVPPKKKPEAKEIENSKINQVISKLPPVIQVKKFASINPSVNPAASMLSEAPAKKPPRPQKRSLSPKGKPLLLNPVSVSSAKKLKLPPWQEKPVPIMPSPPKPRYAAATVYNGYRFTTHSSLPDNINLSIESLTQGLNMSAVSALTHSEEDDVVCTPDFCLEPVCEVTEDAADDDVQCMTPAPKATHALPPVLQQSLHNDNIVQMTDSDVTVNSATGGLKFRVDPQTLSSNKMYRLPDGRIFAINPNPSMPGGYSATIVAVADNTSAKNASKGATFAAKIGPVAKPNILLSKKSFRNSQRADRLQKFAKASPASAAKAAPKAVEAKRPAYKCDLKVPVEWYRYNVIDAVDALEYSLARLQKLKRESTTRFLRTRSVEEMTNLHNDFDRSLNTSITRFSEIRENLNRGLQLFVNKKSGATTISDDDMADDDDVEILSNEDNDDPIFIDENSNDTEEVDLTEAPSSEHNDSFEKETTSGGDSNVRYEKPIKSKTSEQIHKEKAQNKDSSDLDEPESILKDNDISKDDNKKLDKIETTNAKDHKEIGKNKSSYSDDNESCNRSDVKKSCHEPGDKKSSCKSDDNESGESNDQGSSNKTADIESSKESDNKEKHSVKQEKDTDETNTEVQNKIKVGEPISAIERETSNECKEPIDDGSKMDSSDELSNANESQGDFEKSCDSLNGDLESSNKVKEEMEMTNGDDVSPEKSSSPVKNDKLHEISDDMIEDLLKDDVGEGAPNSQPVDCMDISEMT